MFILLVRRAEASAKYDDVTLLTHDMATAVRAAATTKFREPGDHVIVKYMLEDKEHGFQDPKDTVVRVTPTFTDGSAEPTGVHFDWFVSGIESECRSRGIPGLP